MELRTDSISLRAAAHRGITVSRRVLMLSLRFAAEDYAFVYSAGRPIGAIVVGGFRGQLSLLFSGSKNDFEILRPRTVELRFGREELEKLEAQFLTMESTRRHETALACP
jgi:hypothetical protein